MTATLNPTLSSLADWWRRSGSIGRVQVAGESMTPLIGDGDRVRVRAGARLSRGDVVVACTRGTLVVHRVTGRKAGLVVLRGDNSPIGDPPVRPEDILGRVTAVERGGALTAGGLSARLDTPVARAVARATTVYANLQAATGRGPRPCVIQAAALRAQRAVVGSMSPEDQFLLLTARLHVSHGAAVRARALISDGLDWAAVARRAWLGQLGPLVYNGVRQLGEEAGVPRQAVDRLRALYVGNLLRSRKSNALLVETLGLLEAEGIEVLGHKGVALTATVFDDAALHISGDIDLSVRDAERPRAERATRGVRQPLVEAFPTRREPDCFHIELDGTAHHDLDPSLFGAGRWRTGSFDWDGIWRRARPVSVCGRAMLVPCATDLILTLVANGVRRGFTPVRLVSDVAEAIGHFGDDVDWELFGDVARTTGLDHRSWIALGLAADWFEAQVPARLLEPPRGFRPAVYERALLEAKRRQPFLRLPTRVLWAGSVPGALCAAMRLARGRPQRTVQGR